MLIKVGDGYIKSEAVVSLVVDIGPAAVGPYLRIGMAGDRAVIVCTDDLEDAYGLAEEIAEAVNEGSAPQFDCGELLIEDT